MAVLLALLVASFVWSAYSSPKTPESAFFLLPARAWELLLGVVLAFGYSRITLSRLWREALSIAGLLMIGWSCVRYDSQTVFPGVAALLPCAGAALVIATGGRESSTSVQRMLSAKVFVMVGLLSYSIYLWHWPLFAYANYLRFAPLSLNIRLLLIAASVVLAGGSWAYVEQPFRRRRICGSRRAAFSWYAVFACAMFAVGMFVHSQRGLPQRFSSPVVAAASGERDVNPQRRLRHDLPIGRLRDGLPRLGSVSGQAPPVLAVIGDSHCDALMPLMDAMCTELNVPAVAVSRSATIPLFCGPTEGNAAKRAFQDEVRRQLESSQSIRHVLLIARWADHAANVMNRVNLTNTTSQLAASGKKVWILRQVPEQRTSVPRALALSLQWRRDLTNAACTWEEYCAHQSQVDAAFESVNGGGVQILDPAAEFFPDHGVCRISSDGSPLYVDDDHLSVRGALEMRSVVSPMFAEIMTEFDALQTAR